MKQLDYQILINAPVEKVWNCMLQPDTYQEWTAVSWPGSLYEGKWEQGEQIRFVSANGAGMLAIIRKLTPNEYLSAEHIAMLLPGGVEDTSEAGKILMGTMENYRFSAIGKTTLLQIEIITNLAWEDMFNEGWPKALEKLKEICER